ncbi:Tripartite tricarboxylate transporter family receptor [compost metagenome]
MVVNKYVYSNLGYDPLTAYSHVALVAELPNVLMVRNSLGVNNVAELAALAKKQDLSFGSPGVGSSGHVSSELFNLHTKIKATHIPYKGSSPMLADLAGGNIDYSIDQISSALKLIQGGQIKALAVTSKERSPELPNVPTLREAGLSDYEVSVWFCIAAPARTPPEIVATLNAAINKVLKDPAVVQRIAGFAARALGGSTADLTRQVQQEQRNIVAVTKVVNFSN